MEDSDVRTSRADVCVLWHLKSKRILCVTPHTSTATALLTSEVELALNLISGAKPILHAKERSSSLYRLSADSLVNYLFHRQSNSIVKVAKLKAPPKELSQLSELLLARARYLNRVTRVVTRARNRVAPSEKYGELIDFLRKEQALLFRNSGYNEELIQNCLFVFQYAQVKKMTPKEAADEIIFQYNLFEAALWKTEEIKLKYFDLFSNAQTVKQTHEIFQDFVREYYLNSHV